MRNLSRVYKEPFDAQLRESQMQILFVLFTSVRDQVFQSCESCTKVRYTRLKQKKNLKQVIKPQKVVKNSLIKKQKKHTDSHTLPTSQFVIWSGSVRQKKSCSIFNNRFLLNIIILKKRCKVLCKKPVCTGI